MTAEIGALTQEDFTPHIGKSFTVAGSASVLTLAEVNVHDRPNVYKVGRVPFNNIFRGPRDQLLPEGLYTITAEDGTIFTLYMSPVHTSMPDAQEYQAFVC